MKQMHGILASALASAALLIAPVANAASGDIIVTGSTQQGGRLATISLSFPASQQASALWLAWGAADGGDAIGNWDDLEYLGDVPEGDTTWTGPVGTYHAGKTYARIFRIAADTSLVELESVSASGGAYVLTSFTPTGSTVVRCDFRFDDLSANVALFGARKTSGDTQFVMIHTTNLGFRHDYYYGIANSQAMAAEGTRYLVEMDYTRLMVNGEPFVDLHYSGPSNFTTPCPLMVFAMNNNGSSAAPAPATMYSFQAWSDTARTTLALDLVPCAQNGIAGLYDRAHGAFLAPSGGTLAAGAAKTHSTCGTLVGSSAALAPYGTDRSVSVARFSREGRQPKANLTFTAGLAECDLVAVHGPADAGDNIADWPNAAFLGTIPASTTSMTATIPWRIPDETPHFFRFFLVSPINPVTGDSFRLFEGLRANGGSYVLTDFTPTGTTVVQCDCQFDDLSANVALFGARKASGDTQFVMIHTTDQGFRHDYYGGIANSRVMAATGTRYRIEMDYTRLMVNGEPVVDLHYSGPDNFTTPCPLMVFAMNNNGSSAAPAPATMYSFQAWSDTGRSTLALDLVPCERNGVAGFWDKVESRFLGRSGSGVLETVGDEIVDPYATVLSRSSTLPLPSPSAFVITVR